MGERNKVLLLVMQTSYGGEKVIAVQGRKRIKQGLIQVTLHFSNLPVDNLSDNCAE